MAYSKSSPTNESSDSSTSFLIRSKSFEHHAAAIALFPAYYNFLWRTRYPDNGGKAGELILAARFVRNNPDSALGDRARSFIRSAPP